MISITGCSQLNYNFKDFFKMKESRIGVKKNIKEIFPDGIGKESKYRYTWHDIILNRMS